MAHKLSFDAEQFLAMYAEDRCNWAGRWQNARKISGLLADEMERVGSKAKIKIGH